MRFGRDTVEGLRLDHKWSEELNRPVAKPSLKKGTPAWERAKAALLRGDLDKVKAAMVVTPEVEAELVKECSE